MPADEPPGTGSAGAGARQPEREPGREPAAIARAPDGRRLPISPQVGPYVVRVEEGKTYLWCSCGLSRSQPYCDGSHAGTGFEPVPFDAFMDAEFHLCGCKRSDNKPYCFGNCRGHHRRLSEK